MRLQPLRGSFTVLATFLVLAISFDSSPILPNVPKPTRPAPDARSIALVDELTGHAPPRGKLTSDLHVVRPAELDSALSGEPLSHNPGLFEEAEQRQVEADVVRKLPFGRAIVQAAERHGLDPLLLASIVETESAFAPDAVSREGAIGLMQLIPDTGKLYGKTNLFDPYVNLDVGSQYVGALLERYHGDLALALAAYNCGPGTVTRYGAVPPYAETRDFVKSVIALYVDHRQSAWQQAKGSPAFLSSALAGGQAGAGRRPAGPESPRGLGLRELGKERHFGLLASKGSGFSGVSGFSRVAANPPGSPVTPATVPPSTLLGR
ncbi:MAG TPA: lytic transglycosylase domain-containing protein [Thermoanaerobaculia bacterium]|nr:lytic transglycosylase domain-containing protein [Thermoanaerobaculia bacterium]